MTDFENLHGDVREIKFTGPGINRVTNIEIYIIYEYY